MIPESQTKKEKEIDEWVCLLRTRSNHSTERGSDICVFIYFFIYSRLSRFSREGMMDGRKVMNKCLVLEKTREGRRSGRRNQTAEQSREPTCLSIFWEKSHVFISKLPSPMLPAVPICSCCIKKKIETSVRRAPDREKQSC